MPTIQWEDYAVAFIAGGAIKGFNLSGLIKFGVDVAGRPLASQFVKAGTRDEQVNWDKYFAEVFVRGATYGAPEDLKPLLRGMGAGYYHWVSQNGDTYVFYWDPATVK